MRLALLFVVRRLLTLDPFPLLKPVGNSLGVRVRVQVKAAELIARPAALAKHGSVVPVPGVPPYLDGHHLAGPALAQTADVAALEIAHDVGRVCLDGAAVVFALEPCVRDLVGRRLYDRRME